MLKIKDCGTTRVNIPSWTSRKKKKNLPRIKLDLQCTENLFKTKHSAWCRFPDASAAYLPSVRISQNYLPGKGCWDFPRLPAWPRSRPGQPLAPGGWLRCSPCKPSWRKERRWEWDYRCTRSITSQELINNKARAALNLHVFPLSLFVFPLSLFVSLRGQVHPEAGLLLSPLNLRVSLPSRMTIAPRLILIFALI